MVRMDRGRESPRSNQMKVRSTYYSVKKICSAGGGASTVTKRLSIALLVVTGTVDEMFQPTSETTSHDGSPFEKAGQHSIQQRSRTEAFCPNLRKIFVTLLS